MSGYAGEGSTKAGMLSKPWYSELVGNHVDFSGENVRSDERGSDGSEESEAIVSRGKPMLLAQDERLSFASRVSENCTFHEGKLADMLSFDDVLGPLRMRG